MFERQKNQQLKENAEGKGQKKEQEITQEQKRKVLDLIDFSNEQIRALNEEIAKLTKLVPVQEKE